MSRKRYSETINPQVAVQDYLDDLLQQIPASSPLDKLKREEDQAKAAEALKVERIAESKADDNINQAQSTAPHPETTQERSLASQRLQQKRALARAPEKEYREPFTFKSSPILSGMLKTSTELKTSTKLKTTAELKVKPQPSSNDQVPQEKPVKTIVTEKRHIVVGDVRDDRVETKKRQADVSPPKDIEAMPERALKTTVKADTEVDKGSAIAQSAALSSQAPVDHWLENGRPDWAQGRFECLIFTVAGLKLAVPLVSLGAIHAMEQELTPLVGRPAWFLGLLPVAERNIRVVDSARWIMPERYNDAVKDNYRFVIRLDNSEWGMACDSVAQSFSLTPEEVRWRTDRGKRPWLAGTVIDHMCALMDVAAVSRLLSDSEQRNHSPI